MSAGALVKEGVGKRRRFVWRDSVVIQRLAWLLMTITPALGTAVLIAWLDVSLDNFTPASSDEVGYYLQINAFVHHGFSGGYFTILENPAPATFSHFGVHGPLFPVLYGSLGKLVGWHVQSAPFFNVALLTLSIAAYCLLIQPTTGQSLLGTALLATFWPFYLCILSVLQDPVHWAIAIVVAAGFYGILRARPWARSAVFQLLFLAVLVYASLMRISWAMFLVPYLLLQVRRPTFRRLGLALVASVVGMAALLYAFRWLCAPYVGVNAAFLMNKVAGGEVPAEAFFEHAVHNLERLMKHDFSFRCPFLASVIFWEAIGFGSIVGLLALWRLAATPRDRLRADFWPVTRELWFHAFNICGLCAGILFFYFVNNDGGWRMLAVHLLVSAFIAITSTVGSLKGLVVAIVLVNLAALPKCAASIEAQNGPRFEYAEMVRRFGSRIGKQVQYREGADPWQNTILIGPYPIELMALPPGIGVSYYGAEPERVTLPIKSRYVLATDKAAKKQNWKLSKLARFKVLHDSVDYPPPNVSATLYLNQAPPYVNQNH
jgi:hypothetical protein